jgi:ankyrin repeat protein
MQLHCAAWMGNARWVERLVQAGADVNSKSSWWGRTTPLHWANSAQVARALLQAGADVHATTDPRTTDYDAARAPAFAGAWGTTQNLMARATELNKNRYGATPLLCAAERGKVPVAEVLLEHGADPNAKDCYGTAPLNEAASRKKTAIVELLLRHGAHPDEPNRWGTPLQSAIQNKDSEAVRLLLAHGADPNRLDSDNPERAAPPLWTAIRYRQPEVLKLLVDAGADTSWRDSYGNNLLHMTVASGMNYDRLIGDMLSLGFAADATNDKGETPLQIAERRDYKSTIRALRKRA